MNGILKTNKIILGSKSVGMLQNEAFLQSFCNILFRNPAVSKALQQDVGKRHVMEEEQYE